MRAKEFIKELFEPVFKNTKKNVSHDLKALKAKANKPGVKSGAFGYVVDTPNDPGTVTKTAFDDDAGSQYSKFKDNQVVDAYYIWVKLCARNNQMAQNPFLPRVYVVDEREDENGQRIPRYQMEKLYPPNIEMINSDMLMSIAEQVGVPQNEIDKKLSDPFLLGWLATKEKDEYEIQKDKEFKKILWNLIIKTVSYEYFDKNNKELNQAYTMVNYITSSWRTRFESEIWEDMHSGNFMIRITNVGPQLVFTDPIAGAVPFSDAIEFLEVIGPRI
jgi:hypothetical protein